MGVLKVKVGGVWESVAQSINVLASPGYVGHANGTDQSGIGATMTDLTGMSVSFNAIAGHTYKTTAILSCYPSVGPASIVAQITNVANSLIKRSFVTVPTANHYADIAIVAVETGLSGAQTRKVQANTSAGALTIYSAATTAVIIVEDITPATPVDGVRGADDIPAGYSASFSLVTAPVNPASVTVATLVIPTSTRRRLLVAHWNGLFGYAGNNDQFQLTVQHPDIATLTRCKGGQTAAMSRAVMVSANTTWTYTVTAQTLAGTATALVDGAIQVAAFPA